MDLTIILVTHNSAEVLDRCLRGIDEGLRAQVVVVDNASRDQTLAVARQHGVRVIGNRENLGYAPAANAGARAADQPYLCFLNPDCSPSRDLFLQGLQALRSNARRCVAPVLDEGKSGAICGRQPGYTRLKLVADTVLTNYGDNWLCRWLQDWPGYHDSTWWWAHGACFFISRDFFLQLGGFDERFYLYMEDVDFGRRLSAAGGEVADLSFRLSHQRGTSCRVSAGRRLALLNLARIRYARENYGLATALALGLIALPAWALRAAMAR